MEKLEIMQLLCISDKRELPKIYLPNEIFKELSTCPDLVKGGTSHVAFAYSYVYLSFWLYRYCKYYEDQKITQDDIKKILGYSRTYKKLDYIIKKGGILDQLGYTCTTTDFPISWSIDDNGFVHFQTIKDIKCDYGKSSHTHSRNYKVKYPVKAFHRTEETEKEQVLDGTFYDVYNTHQVPLEVFLYCMANDDVNVIGFYLYSFLKHGNDLFNSGLDISHKNLINETGIRKDSVDSYLENLIKHCMIECDVKPYVFNLPQYMWRANTYRTNEFLEFGEISTPIEKRSVLSLYTHKKQNPELFSDADKAGAKYERIEFDDALLPF